MGKKVGKSLVFHDTLPQQAPRPAQLVHAGGCDDPNLPQSQCGGKTVVDTAGSAVQIGMGVDGANTVCTQQLHRPPYGSFIRHGLEGLENQGMVGDNQLRAPSGGFLAHALKGVEGDQNFCHRAVSAAAEQAHVVPVHFHRAGSKGLKID